MMWLLLYCFLALTGAGSLGASVANDDTGVFGYHRKFGIPQAARIKRAEEEYHNDVNGHFNRTRIINGLPASLGEIPYQAGVIASTAYGDSVCGAVVVTRNRLLTSAHCWNDGQVTAVRLEVVLGSVLLFSGGTRLRTSNVETHPSYRAIPREHDIAIIYVAWMFYSDTISNIRLPFGDAWDEDFSGYSAMTSGYGLMSNTGSYTEAQSLRYVWLEVITTQLCSQVHGNLIEASLCARATTNNTGASICYGDFGGPLVTEYEGQVILIGLSSYVSLFQCEWGSPSVFTRVTSHREWFEDKL